MTRVGWIELRVWKEGDYLEVLDYTLREPKGYRGEPLVYGCGPDDLIRDMMSGRTDGVWDIAGEYLEEYNQDYYGEWDGDYSIERERFRYRGPVLMDAAIRASTKPKKGRKP